MNRDLAGQVTVAIRRHRRYLHENGHSEPPGYAALEDSLAALAVPQVPPSASEGHRMPKLLPSEPVRKADEVSPNVLLTLPQTAVLLQYSLRTVKRRVAAGRIRSVRDGRLIRIEAAEITGYIARQSTPTAAPHQGA